MIAYRKVGQRGKLPRLGALAQWRAEVRAGNRENIARDFDDVAAAACWEVRAYELKQSGDLERGQYAMDTALLRLHGCYGRPDDGTERHPGPGRRLFRSLLRQAGTA